ncbi:MAG: DUF6132 family protein [Bacteroidetes bacterium]|jgi:phage shock protein E|nr:DUF6132 family protein [Bacteroidota bacterium]MCB0604871.1 hypothetical protein [Saprospiraceae bacterium]MCO5278173.1 DUF6132 family protein [Saprospiraceae bacterium]
MSFVLKYKFALLGIILGAIGGYAYYYFIGCSTGTCPITSNPIISTGYGALLGGLFLSDINYLKKKNNQNE